MEKLAKCKTPDLKKQQAQRRLEGKNAVTSLMIFAMDQDICFKMPGYEFGCIQTNLQFKLMENRPFRCKELT